MLSLNRIRQDHERLISLLALKNFDASSLIPQIIQLDDQRRACQSKQDDLLAESNRLAKTIGHLFQQGKQEEANRLRQKTADLKSESKLAGAELEEVTKTLNGLLLEIPNIPHPSVPSGHSDGDNEIILVKDQLIALADNAKPHWELAKTYDLIDFDLGSKVTGAGFPFYKGQGARLQRALINFFLDEAIAQGYVEYLPPLAVNSDSAYGTGQLPDKEGQMYHIQMDDLYLIPTAEVPLTNIYRDVLLREEELPVKNVAYSACFRREAGSYGKDVRGLNRLHQFDKVEIVQIARPDQSYQILEEMRQQVGQLLEKLELPYRIVKLCGGDLSFSSSLTYDFEVFSAAQKKWLEVSSVSNFEDFQANRLKLRYKATDGKNKIAHTLNGSALALPRILAALLENNQDKKGIHIPAALHDYAGFTRIE